MSWKNGHQGHRGSGRDAFRIWRETHDPMLRWPDVPGGGLLADLLVLDPQDRELGELYELTRSAQVAKALQASDPFWGAFPPQGSLPRLERGRIPLVALPTGDVLSIDAREITCNVVVCGPTGQGKTSWLRLAILSLLEAS